MEICFLVEFNSSLHSSRTSSSFSCVNVVVVVVLFFFVDALPTNQEIFQKFFYSGKVKPFYKIT